jgi:hypothetical protein
MKLQKPLGRGKRGYMGYISFGGYPNPYGSILCPKFCLLYLLKRPYFLLSEMTL